MTKDYFHCSPAWQKVTARTLVSASTTSAWNVLSETIGSGILIIPADESHTRVYCGSCRLFSRVSAANLIDLLRILQETLWGSIGLFANACVGWAWVNLTLSFHPQDSSDAIQGSPMKLMACHTACCIDDTGLRLIFRREYVIITASLISFLPF